MNDKIVNNWKVLLAFGAIYLVWGSTFLAALIGLNGLPPYLMVSLRFTAAGIILYAWSRFSKEQHPDAATIRAHSISGILMLVGGTASVVWAEQYIPSGVAAIIVAALPIWFIVLDKPQWKNNFQNKLTLAGIIIGFTGIVLLSGFEQGGAKAVTYHRMRTFSVLLLTAGCLSWAAGSLYSRNIQSSSSTTMTVSMQLLAAGAFSLLISVLLGEWHAFSWSQVTLQAWLALVYMILLGSVVTYLAYIWLLTIRPAVQVGTYAYVNPMVAVLLGWAFAGEQITMRQLISLAAVVSGVLLINLPKYKSVKI